MSILLHYGSHLPSILSTLSIHGLRFKNVDGFELKAEAGSIIISVPGGLKIKKGDNKIELPTLLMTNAAAFVEPSDELLEAAASIRGRILHTNPESAPVLYVLATEATTVYSLAHVSLLKGGFR